MAKAGKGVRTRQYNPKSEGAINLAQYVQAAVDHVRGAHDEAGAIIHATPKTKRREFAREIWFRRGYRGKNPKKRSLSQKIETFFPKGRSAHASDFFADLEDRLLGERPSLHKAHATREPSIIGKKNPERSESEKLSHAAVKFESPSRHPGQACASCVHLVAASPPRCEAVKSPIKKTDWCARYQKRGKNMSEADAFYKKFHGRGPDKITTMLVAGADPYGGHPELTSLGPLIRMVVGQNVEVGDDGEIESADWVNEITFVPSMPEYRRLTERLDPHDAQDVRQFKAWLKSVGAPDVAGVPPKGDQLYFVGGKQALDDAMLRKFGSDPAKDLSDLGDCFLIEYFAQKRFDRFEPITYYHHLGEETGVQPRLIYRKPQRMLELVGGEYTVKAAGIEN